MITGAYSACENAVVSRFIAYFPGKLNDERCKAGDIDAVIDKVYQEGNTFGCFFDFAGMRTSGRSPVDTQFALWDIDGVFVIRHTSNAETEENLRQILDTLPSVFDNDRRLGGAVDKVTITGIGRPEPVKIDSVSFYWLPFIVTAMVRT